MAPLEMKDVTFDENKTQNQYISDGQKLENTGICPSRTIKISNVIQAERK